MFYDQLQQLCKEKGISMTKLVTDIGMSKSAVTYWKNTDTTPKAEIVQKIADYFDVPVTSFFEEKENTPEDIEKINEIRSLMKDERFIRLQRAVSRMDDNTKDRAIKTLEAAFEEFFSDDYIDTDTEE